MYCLYAIARYSRLVSLIGLAWSGGFGLTHAASFEALVQQQEESYSSLTSCYMVIDPKRGVYNGNSPPIDITMHPTSKEYNALRARGGHMIIYMDSSCGSGWDVTDVSPPAARRKQDLSPVVASDPDPGAVTTKLPPPSPAEEADRHARNKPAIESLLERLEPVFAKH